LSFHFFNKNFLSLLMQRSATDDTAMHSQWDLMLSVMTRASKFTERESVIDGSRVLHYH
jgi:uncharacterized membrane protein